MSSLLSSLPSEKKAAILARLEAELEERRRSGRLTETVERKRARVSGYLDAAFGDDGKD
jgi:hypothetical protein